ncbi:hypothetical protein [Morganella morganii]|uniref:hypothetical protein n=1 Tax=Morganella morganii TaxID=582 RepID=UPI0021CF60B2|nr:hypothetical protein [Morganella morganii]
MAAFVPPADGMTLIIHSKLDRPILGFSVNGVAGGNTWAHDPDNKFESGGATTCVNQWQSSVTASCYNLVMYIPRSQNVSFRLMTTGTNYSSNAVLPSPNGLNKSLRACSPVVQGYTVLMRVSACQAAKITENITVVRLPPQPGSAGDRLL